MSFLQMLHFIIIISVIMIKINSFCNDDNCYGPYKLHDVKPINSTIKRTNINALLTINAENVEIIASRRSVWYSYCYDGTSLDRNTGCIEELLNLLPTKTEAEKWYNEMSCQIGDICNEEQRCIGDDAKTCLVRKTRTKKGQTSHNRLGKSYRLFAKHTCTMSWECTQKLMEIPISVVLDNDVDKMFFTTNTGQAVEINQKFIEEGFLLDNSTILHIHKPISKETSNVECHCFITIGASMKCVISNSANTNEIGLVFNFNQNVYKSSSENYYIEIDKNINFDGVIKQNMNNLHILNTVEHEKKLRDLHHSSSIEDVKEIMKDIQLLQYQTNFNIMNLIELVNNMQLHIIHMTESLSKVDDELIGNMIGKHQRTKWFNKKKFFQCPCIIPFEDPMVNCDSMTIFKDGRYKQKTNLSDCKTMDKKGIKELDLFSSEKYDFTPIKDGHFRESYNSYEGWTWVSLMKEQMLANVFEKPTQQVFNYKEKSEVISQIRSIGIKSYLSLANSIIGWVSFILIIFRR